MIPTMERENLFSKYVQPGRLCVIGYGPDYNKIAVIVDIIHQNRVLIDGPTTNVARQSIPIKRLQLTDVVVKNVFKGCRTKVLKGCLESQKTVEEFAKTSWGKKRASQAFRASMNDFQRFHLMVAHKKRRALILQSMGKKTA